MRALMVSTVPTDPLDAGNRARVASLAAAIRALGVELHFAHIHTEHHDGSAMARRFGARRYHHLPFLPLPPPQAPLRRAWRAIGRRLNHDAGFLWGLDDWYAPHLTDALRALDAVHRFDAVIVEYVWMSRAFEAFGPQVLRILDTHDRFGLRHRDYLASGMRPSWFSTTLAEEERGFRRADAVLAIQPEEAAQFRARLGDAPPEVIEVGHLIDLAPRPLAARPAAVFLASDNPINVQAARWFLAEVMPRLAAHEPDFRLVLAGSICSAVPGAPGVEKLGAVPQVADAFAAGCVAINPVRLGTGVNIKTLDALGCGMPLVATDSAARGLARDDTALLTVANDDAEGFAAAVAALLADAAAREVQRERALAAAARWNATQSAGLARLFAPGYRMRQAASIATAITAPTIANV